MTTTAVPTPVGHWPIWLLALTQLGILAVILALGPLMGTMLLAGLFLLLACVYSEPGFAVLMVVISQFQAVPGLSDASVFALKWAVSLVFVGLLLARRSVQGRRFDFHLDYPERIFLLFAAWCGFCSLFAIHKLATSADAIRIAVYPALVILVRESLTSRRALVLTVLGYVLAVLVGTAYSAAGVSGGPGRWAGFAGNANSFGLFLSFAVPVLAASLLACRGFWLRLLLSASGTLGLVALYLSGSRASLLSVVVQGIAASILFKKTKLLVTMGVVALILVSLVLATTTARDAVFTVLRLQTGTTHRTVLWNAGIDGALKSPLVGYGAALSVEDVHPQIRWGDWAQAFVFKSLDAPFFSHNLYIGLVLAAGFPGLILFGASMWALCRRHLRAGREAPSRGLRVANYTIVAMVFGGLVNGIFEVTAFIGKGAINNYFWVAVGIVAAYAKIEGKKIADPLHQS